MEDLAGTGASYPTTDLRGARKAGMTCLAAFKALGLPGQEATRAAIAADLQRGLWVMSAETIYGQSCTIVSLKVLDRDAASLKGHRYRFHRHRLRPGVQQRPGLLGHLATGSAYAYEPVHRRGRPRLWPLEG